MRARGEDVSGDMSRNGEAALQRAVLAALGNAPFVQVLDIGANRGEWTLSLLQQAPASQRTADRLRIDLFEPVPSTRDVLAATLGGRGNAASMRIHSAAISDETGTSRIALMSETGGTNTLHSGSAAVPPAGG